MSNTKVTRPAQGKQVPCKKDRTLVVDDEIRNLFRQLVKLELPQCRLDIAVNGAEALEMFLLSHQAMLILDVRMAVMDGEKTFLEIEKLCTERNWEMPSVVFCTGHEPSPRIRAIVAQLPKHCLLCKPVSNDVLLDAIKTRLKK